jgi:hypothetical protein
MKKIITFVILFASFNFLVVAQDAGISDPANGIIIHENNRSTYFVTSDLSELRVDGWSVAGSVSWIKVYVNGYLDGSVTNPNAGSWYKDVEVTPGNNDLYLQVRCNYGGCALTGYTTSQRTITYVKPFETGDFYVEMTSDDKIKIHFYPYSTANFYYRVFRSTSPTGSLNAVGDWTQSNEVIDANANTPGQEYYYWIDVAIDNSGSYNSGIERSEYRSITYPVELNVSSSSLNYTSTGGMQSTNITSNVNWTATTSANWITISQASGTGNATLNISLGNSEENRSGTVSISGGGVTRVVNISQTGNPPSIETLLPADNSTDIAVDANFQITFNEEINATSGKYINIYQSNGSLASGIEATNSQVSISNEVVTINPTNDLGGGLNYYILIDDGAFKDNSNNTYAGISANSVWNFSTVAQTNPPDAPANVSANAVSTSEIEVSWNAVPLADYYHVLSCDESITYSTTTTTTSLLVDNFNSATTYDFIVKSENNVGLSSPSSCVSATTYCAHNWGGVTIYPNSTTAYGIVTIDGSPASDGDLVGAFVGAECRAIGDVIVFDGVAYVTLNIQGISVETIVFKVWSNAECAELNVSLTVQSNPGGILGYPPNYLQIAAEASAVSTNNLVQNISIANAQTECYDATNTITVAGSGTTVVVNTGGQALFVAGSKVIFNPGFSAHNGSYVQAFITTTGDYCSSQQAMMASQDNTMEIEEWEDNLYETAGDGLDVNIYPNPTTGSFTIDFMGKMTNAGVAIYNFQGNLVRTIGCSDKTQLVLKINDLPAGIYIAIIKTNTEIIKKKVIKL